jgi:hypothetical protein
MIFPRNSVVARVPPPIITSNGCLGRIGGDSDTSVERKDKGSPNEYLRIAD